MKKIVPVFILLIISIILTACVSDSRFQMVSQDNQVNSKVKTKLRFISSWGGIDSKAGALQEVLNKYMEENPSVEIINESMYGDDFLLKIKTDFASGYNPDVFGLWPGSDIRALVESGMVADLTEDLDHDYDWKSSFDQNNWKYTTFDGRIYGLPLEIIYEGLFINRDLFEKYNVKVPRDYQELKSAVVKFKQYGIIPIAFNCKAEGTYLYQNIIARLGGREGTENPIENGKVNRCYIDAMNYVKELYSMGAFPQDALVMNSRERNDLFKSKKAAMIVQGSWFIGEVGDSVDIVPFPFIEGGKSHQSSLIYGFGCGTFYMSKTASRDDIKKELSLKLLKRLTARDTVAFFSNETGMLSNVGSEYLNKKTTNKDTRPIKTSERQLLLSDELIGPPDSFVNRTVWEGIIVQDFPYFLEGEKTAEEVWEQARLAYESLNYK